MGSNLPWPPKSVAPQKHMSGGGSLLSPVLSIAPLCICPLNKCECFLGVYVLWGTQADFGGTRWEGIFLNAFILYKSYFF